MRVILTRAGPPRSLVVVLRCPGGNWGDAGLLRNNVYTQFVIGTNGRFGPYAQVRVKREQKRLQELREELEDAKIERRIQAAVRRPQCH